MSQALSQVFYTDSYLISSDEIPSPTFTAEETEVQRG